MKVIQARQATLGTEVVNIQKLLKDLAELRQNWQAVWNEATTVASNLGIEIKLPARGNSALRRNVSVGKGKESVQEAYYRTFIFYAIIDIVIGGLIMHCNAVKRIKERFDVGYYGITWITLLQ